MQAALPPPPPPAADGSCLYVLQDPTAGCRTYLRGIVLEMASESKGWDRLPGADKGAVFAGLFTLVLHRCGWTPATARELQVPCRRGRGGVGLRTSSSRTNLTRCCLTCSSACMR